MRRACESQSCIEPKSPGGGFGFFAPCDNLDTSAVYTDRKAEARPQKGTAKTARYKGVMDMARILVAEDELICKNLELVGHRPLSAQDGREALRLAQKEKPDLALLDVMLPEVDGFAVKQALGEEMPVIFVTAKISLSDKLKGLNLGAEDYITKPFEMLELLARIQTVLRRVGKNAKRFCWRGLQVDLASHTVVLNGAPVDLTPQEYSLLETLLLNRNIALSRERLLESAWGYDYMGETRTVDNHILRLRKKLGLEKEIQTVYKLGYRLALPEE